MRPEYHYASFRCRHDADAYLYDGLVAKSNANDVDGFGVKPRVATKVTTKTSTVESTPMYSRLHSQIFNCQAIECIASSSHDSFMNDTISTRRTGPQDYEGRL